MLKISALLLTLFVGGMAVVGVANADAPDGTGPTTPHQFDADPGDGLPPDEPGDDPIDGSYLFADETAARCCAYRKWNGSVYACVRYEEC